LAKREAGRAGWAGWAGRFLPVPNFMTAPAFPAPPACPALPAPPALLRVAPCYHRPMSLDERDFFNTRNETRTDRLSCPRCKRVNEYQMRWVVNTRKDRLPGGANERD